MKVKIYIFFLFMVSVVCSCGKKSGTLVINASEDSSTVYINKEYKGKTPLVINNLSLDKYELRVTKDGYDEYIDSFEINNDSITALNIKLPVSYITYLDYYWGYKVNYPADWIKVDLQNSVAFGAPKKAEDKVNIGFGVGVTSAYLFSDYAESTEKKMENCVMGMKNNRVLLYTKILSKNVISIDSYPAYRIEYNFSNGLQEIKARLINIFANNKVYSISFMAESKKFDQYAKTFDRIANSFSILK